VEKRPRIGHSRQKKNYKAGKIEKKKKHKFRGLYQETWWDQKKEEASSKYEKNMENMGSTRQRQISGHEKIILEKASGKRKKDFVGGFDQKRSRD